MNNTKMKKLGIVKPIARGNWDSDTTYLELNIVRYNNASYISKKNSINIIPDGLDISSDYWKKLSEDGKDKMQSNEMDITYTKFYSDIPNNMNEYTLLATSSKNINFENGKIKCIDLGLETYLLDCDETATIPKIPESYGNALKFFTWNWENSSGVQKDSIGCLAENQKLFVYDLDLDAFKMISSEANLMKAVKYIDNSDSERIIFCGKKEAYAYDLLNLKKWIFKSTELRGVISYKTILIFVGENRVHYTRRHSYDVLLPIIYDYNPNGKFQGIEKIGEDIYLFREFGISRLFGLPIIRQISTDEEGNTTYIDTNDNVVTPPTSTINLIEDIPYSGGFIYNHTLCVCGNKILFLASDGLYSFDGKTCKPIGLKLNIQPYKISDGFVNNAEIYFYSAYFNNKFFLVYTDINKEHKSIYIDLTDENNCGETYIPYGLTVSDGKVIVDNEREISKIVANADLPIGEEYSFEVKGMDFDTIATKNIQYIMLRGDGICQLTLSSEQGESIAYYDFSESVNLTKEFNLQGTQFDLKLTLQKGCVIEKMSFKVSKES